MKILLVSMNARYEHEGLAVHYLAASLPDGAHDVQIVETTINDDPMRAYSACVEARPDLIGLSCYVWNRRRMVDLCSDLRLALPDVRIVAGGPELDRAESRKAFELAGADFVLLGEGEASFRELAGTLASGRRPDEAAQARWRSPGRQTPSAEIPSPFGPAHLERLRDRIAYLEASRGCPFRCSYCLSSESGAVRHFPIERVQEDLLRVIAAGPSTVKFVDRTFNLDTDRFEILCRFLAEHAPDGMRFHFEIAPDLLNERQMEILASMPAGLVQIEAGVQSVHEKTLNAIRRRMDVNGAIDRLTRVTAVGNVHVHADLIAGLPGETASEFRESFDRLFGTGVHHLQLGFLKVLGGTAMERQAAELGYRVRGHAPYEVISSDAMSAMDLIDLKDFEETTERYLNSGRFVRTMRRLAPLFDAPHRLMDALKTHQIRNGMMHRAVSPATLHRELVAFCLALDADARTHAALMKDLAVDFVRSTANSVLPEWMETDAVDAVLQGNSLAATPDAEQLLKLFADPGRMASHGLTEERILRMSAKERRKRFVLFGEIGMVDTAVRDRVDGLASLLPARE